MEFKILNPLGLSLRDCASSETDMHTYQVFPILELGLWDWETRKTWEGLEMLGRKEEETQAKVVLWKASEELAAPEQVRKWTAKWLSELTMWLMSEAIDNCKLSELYWGTKVRVGLGWEKGQKGIGSIGRGAQFFQGILLEKKRIEMKQYWRTEWTKFLSFEV